jgi:hypothetical protein
MRNLIIAILSFMLVVGATPAYAVDRSEEDVFRELIVVSGFEEQWAIGLEQLWPRMREGLRQANPELTDREHTIIEEEVLAAMDRSRPILFDWMANAYANHLSLEEAESIIRFFNKDVGKNYKVATIAIWSEFYTHYFDKHMQEIVIPQMQKGFIERLKAEWAESDPYDSTIVTCMLPDGEKTKVKYSECSEAGGLPLAE